MLIILGTNRTGKTTLTKEIITGMNRKRKLVLTPDPYEPKWNEYPLIKRSEIATFEGTRKLFYNKNDFIGLNANLTDCVLILDDFGAFEDMNQKEQTALKRLLVRRAQKKIDIFVIAHGFTDIVPTFLYRYVSQFIIFKTEDNMNAVKQRIKRFDELKKIVEKVDKSKDKHFYEIFNLK